MPNLTKVTGADIPDNISLDLWPPETFADVCPDSVDPSMTNVIIIFNNDLWSQSRFDKKAGDILLAHTSETVMLVQPECLCVLHQPLPLAVGNIGWP